MKVSKTKTSTTKSKNNILMILESGKNSYIQHRKACFKKEEKIWDLIKIKIFTL